MKIGFIGLGNMGAPMARNLADAGYDVTGFDLEPDLCRIAADKLTIADDVASASRGRDIVITMLPNGLAVRDVATEAIPAMQKSTCFIDCSTVDIRTATDVATMIDSAGLCGLDAPVSGGVGGAKAGTLTFMVGGSLEALRLANPLLDVMGQQIIHCGDAGAGQAAKICNNMILGATMIVTCEAFALADNLGLDRQKLFDVVSTSSGSSWSMNSYCPVAGVGPKTPADNDYKPGFSTAMMVKDLALAQDASKMTGTGTSLGKAALTIYEDFATTGDAANEDFSAILTVIKQP